MNLKTIRGITPQVGRDCFIADNALLIGDVIIGSQCSIWFGSILRGDVNYIRIGNRVNIQDGCILHTTYQKTTIHIGDNVSVGHGVILHGATLEEEVLIGMGAIIMDYVHIGKHAIIAAGALVKERTVVEPGSIWAGVPAKKIGKVTEKQINDLIRRTAENYIKYSKWYLEG